MNREHYENIILEKLEEIIAIYHEYNPTGEYMNFCYRKDDHGEDLLSFNNEHWEADKEKPIRVYGGESWPCC